MALMENTNSQLSQSQLKSEEKKRLTQRNVIPQHNYNLRTQKISQKRFFRLTNFFSGIRQQLKKTIQYQFLKFISSVKATTFCPLQCPSNLQWRYCKILWPSQNIRSLMKSIYLRDHPFKTSANFHKFGPYPPTVGSFLVLSVGKFGKFLTPPSLIHANVLMDGP